MSSDNKSYLRFSVEESVWFQKGQEVSELISISLDPDINIQEHDQYVSIKGALRLTGEYRIDQSTQEEDDRDFTSVRLVNEISTREDGITELNHRFPVDITIPRDRIRNLDDVYVGVDSFDYEIPKRGCLQVVADLSISGISESVQNQQQVVAEHRGEPEDEVLQPEYLFTEVEKELNSEYTNQEVVEVEDEVSNVQETAEQLTESYVEEEEDDSDIFTPFEVEARREVYQEDEEDTAAPQEAEAQVVVPQIEMKSRSEKILNFSSGDSYNKSVVALDAKTESQSELQNEGKQNKGENALYLTKIFARDEEEDFSKMRICIVQNGDSIDKIAERYEISVQQLVRINQLGADYDVNEGQLLYIPVQR